MIGLHKSDITGNSNYYLLGDEHLGSEAASTEKISEAVGIIKSDKGAHWGHMGDALEAIHLGDPRFDPDVHRGKKAILNAQLDIWEDVHSPILDTMDFLLDGNHEETIIKVFNPAEEIARRIKNKYDREIGWGGRTIAIGLNGYRLFATHGARAVNSLAGDIMQREMNDCIRIKRLLRDLRSDCHVMAMGHIHKLRVHPPIKKLNLLTKGNKLKESYSFDYTTSDGVLHEDARWYCSTGSFMRGYIYGATSYGEKLMYPPTELGFIKISVKNGRVENVEKIIL
jgi:hypothetical protein